jgi:phenylpyruvate tautomerase PptA (4-oxalocrotonate tautomerase family)
MTQFISKNCDEVETVTHYTECVVNCNDAETMIVIEDMKS